MVTDKLHGIMMHRYPTGQSRRPKLFLCTQILSPNAFPSHPAWFPYESPRDADLIQILPRMIVQHKTKSNGNTKSTTNGPSCPYFDALDPTIPQAPIQYENGALLNSQTLKDPHSPCPFAFKSHDHSLALKLEFLLRLARIVVHPLLDCHIVLLSC